MNAIQKQLIDSVFERGVLIDLDISCWQGQIANKPEDFGLETVPEDLMSLGRKRIVRKELVQKPISIRSTAVWYIEGRSYPFPLSRARFVPYSRLKEVVTKLEEYKMKFDESTESVIWEYDSEKESFLKTWRREIERHFGERVDTDKAIQRIVNAAPSSSEEIRRRYGFAWRLFDIKVPPQIETHITDAKAHEEMDKAIKGFVGECVSVMRARVADLLVHINELTAKSKKGGMFSSASVNSIKKTVDQLKSINFFNDGVLNRDLDALKGAIDGNYATKESVDAAVGTIFKNIQGDLDASVASAIDNLTGTGERDMEV